EGCRIVNLNSSLHHLNEALAKRGKVEHSLVEDLTTSLKAHGERPLNILLTHHHPWKLGLVNLGDNSHMEGGEVLLESLLTAAVGSWLVIHGHKHLPRVDYFAGGTTTVPIMACGSLSARLWDEAAAVAKNQFYIVDFDVDRRSGGLDEVAARCSAW